MLFDDAILIGKATKVRPGKGSLQIVLNNIDAKEIGGNVIIAEIDGLKVPFQVEERSDRGGSIFVMLKEYNPAIGYFPILGCNIYCRREDLVEPTPSSAHPFRPLIGCNVCDKGNNIGKITTIDDSTSNTVLTVCEGEREILIPLADEFIDHWDKDANTLFLRLPEGLLDIYDAKTSKAQKRK